MAIPAHSQWETALPPPSPPSLYYVTHICVRYWLAFIYDISLFPPGVRILYVTEQTDREAHTHSAVVQLALSEKYFAALGQHSLASLSKPMTNLIICKSRDHP